MKVTHQESTGIASGTQTLNSRTLILAVSPHWNGMYDGHSCPSCIQYSLLQRPSVEIVNCDVALREVSNRVDNNAVRPNNKDRSMGWFGTKPVMKLTNGHR